MSAFDLAIEWLIHALGGFTHAELHRHGAECAVIGRFDAHREAFERAMAMHFELQCIRADPDEPDPAAPRASVH